MKNHSKAFVLIEYAVLIVIILGGLFVLRDYIQRGFLGRWKEAGDSFAFGRQYDAKKTTECAFDQEANLWYDRNCLENARLGTCAVGDHDCERRILGNFVCVTGTRCDQMNNRKTNNKEVNN